MKISPQLQCERVPWCCHGVKCPLGSGNPHLPLPPPVLFDYGHYSVGGGGGGGYRTKTTGLRRLPIENHPALPPPHSLTKVMKNILFSIGWHNQLCIQVCTGIGRHQGGSTSCRYWQLALRWLNQQYRYRQVAIRVAQPAVGTGRWPLGWLNQLYRYRQLTIRVAQPAIQVLVGGHQGVSTRKKSNETFGFYRVADLN